MTLTPITPELLRDSDTSQRESDGPLVAVQPPGSLAEVQAQCETIEAWVEECDSIPDLRDAGNKLAAIDEYLARTSIDGRARVAATMRRLEGRIGELLGPAENHGPVTPNRGNGLSDRQRSEFRQIAANPDVVEKVISESTDEDPPSRRKVMRAIKDQPKPEWKPAKPDVGGGVSHPARYSSELIAAFRDLLHQHSTPGARILDPFAGTGKIHDLHPEYDTIGIELEAEWANLHPRTQIGNALDLPFDPNTFDAIVTSPTYGNRLADSHNASDPERRRSYTHDLGRDLSAENSGAMHWRNGTQGSVRYRTFHEKAWDEAVLALKPGGVFILNFKDHWRDGALMPVGNWHSWCLGRLGLDYIDSFSISTGNLRQGANGELRSVELVLVYGKPS